MSPDPTAQIYSLDTLQSIPKEPTAYCVLGHPITKSLSRIFQNAAFANAQLPCKYYAVDARPEELGAVVAKLKEKGFGGGNVTMPHKTAIIPFIDALAGSAKVIGAVNTLHHQNGKLIGHNTDAEGWVRAVREEFSADVRDLRVMILGAGGAGRALAFQAALEKCQRLVVVNRTFETASKLAKELSPYFKDDLLQGPYERLKALEWDDELIQKELESIDLLVNATSLGFRVEDPPILPARCLKPHLLVYDIVYRKTDTPLLEAARQAGAKAAGGLSMLLHQGALAFTIWTGESAPIEVMRKSLLDMK